MSNDATIDFAVVPAARRWHPRILLLSITVALVAIFCSACGPGGSAAPAPAAVQAKPSGSVGPATPSRTDFCSEAADYAKLADQDYQNAGDLAGVVKNVVLVAAQLRIMANVAPAEIRTATANQAATWVATAKTAASVDYFSHLADAAWTERNSAAEQSIVAGEMAGRSDELALGRYIVGTCHVHFDPAIEQILNTAAS